MITVVGIGTDGVDGLSAAALRALGEADVVWGSGRQLELLPAGLPAERVRWPSPLRPALPGLLERHAGRAVAVLASGDPMFFGIGRTLVELVGAERVRALPHPSAVSLACALLGWPVEDTGVVSLCGRPASGLLSATFPGRRLLVLSADARTPGVVAELLRAHGFGPTRMSVLEQLGGAGQRRLDGTAEDWNEPVGDALNLIALECQASGPVPHAAQGLADEMFTHDGQVTKRAVRAVTLSALRPMPGQLLWDVGAGCGSVAVEWMRTHASSRAVCVERDGRRAERVTRNAERLGVPALRVVTGAAPEALDGLPTPDAIFVGGGLTTPGLLERCWEALPAGGRLVVNTVTLESEAVLVREHARRGGELTRLEVSDATAVGGFSGWSPARPVTQWAVSKPASRDADTVADVGDAADPGGIAFERGRDSDGTCRPTETEKKEHTS